MEMKLNFFMVQNEPVSTRLGEKVHTFTRMIVIASATG
jgi:hypothetical protein